MVNYLVMPGDAHLAKSDFPTTGSKKNQCIAGEWDGTGHEFHELTRIPFVDFMGALVLV